MATSPQFAGTPLNGSVLLSATADASFTAPTHSVLVVTAGASGSKIDEIRLTGTGTTVTGLINIWAFDSSTYWLIDSVVVPVVTPSTTVAAWVWSKSYPNLILLSNSWSIKVSTTATSQLVCASAFGGSF
jgi:hypothetical protein